MNAVNFKRVLDAIHANPDSWRQDRWHCGTQHCFAGQAQLLAAEDGMRPNIAQEIAKLIELDDKWLKADDAGDPLSITENDEWDRLMDNVKIDAIAFLGVREGQSLWLFNRQRTLRDFQQFYEEHS